MVFSSNIKTPCISGQEEVQYKATVNYSTEKGTMIAWFCKHMYNLILSKKKDHLNESNDFFKNRIK
jgi:hypothetical protein